MYRPRSRAMGMLLIAGLLAGNSAGAGGDLAALRRAATTWATGSDRTAALRQLDAMGGSRTAGIDPAAAAAASEAAADELTGDITFSAPSGTFQGQVSVQLGTTIADAQIRYTTDGTVPSASSKLYSTALTFTATTQVRAQAFVEGTATGRMGTALYVARSVNATSELPLVVMDDYAGGKPTKADAKDVSFMVMAPQTGSTASLAAAPAIATRASFHLRGQSSANFTKAPYKVELRDNQNKDADYSVLGMPADSDWALLGPFPDKTLIRDAFAWDTARAMGLKAPRYAFVELYLNLDGGALASADYQGVYLLAETIKRSADRVDIAKLKKTDTAEPAVSGGYIMELNMMATDGDPTLPCANKSGQPCWSDLMMVYPNKDDLQPAQKTWITNYVQKFHDALHSSNPSNPQTGYPAYIDVDSWVNRIIHNELAKDADSYIRSTHFYKDRGGKIVAGPVWDYDLGYNAMSGFMGGNSVQGWQYSAGFGMGGGGSDWFQKLMQDPTFLAAVKTRWKVLRQGVLSDAQMTARVNALTSTLTNAANRNFQKWSNLGTSMVGGFQTQTTQTWAQQVQIMQTFLTQRAAWLDSNSAWGGGVLPPTSQPPTSQPPTSKPPTTPPPQGGKSCSAKYVKTSEWNTGFQADITVTAGSSPISGWSVTWTFGSGQVVSGTWNALFSSSGATVTARNEGYNGALAAGASTSFGFTGNWSGTNTNPVVTCTAS